MRLVTSRSRATATTSVPSTVQPALECAAAVEDGLLVDQEVAHPGRGQGRPSPGR